MPTRKSPQVSPMWHRAVVIVPVAFCWPACFIAAVLGWRGDGTFLWPLVVVTVLALLLTHQALTPATVADAVRLVRTVWLGRKK